MPATANETNDVLCIHNRFFVPLEWRTPMESLGPMTMEECEQLRRWRAPAGGPNKQSVPIKPEHVEATLRRRNSVRCPWIEVESDNQHGRIEDPGMVDDPFQKAYSSGVPQ